MKAREYMMDDWLLDHPHGCTHCSEHLKKWMISKKAVIGHHPSTHFERLLPPQLSPLPPVEGVGRVRGAMLL
jgi:hypothetical protein